MRRALIICTLFGITACQHGGVSKTASGNAKSIKKIEPIKNNRQFTMSGKRAGEGYFSADGKKMIFQSERDADNPFYQMYVMDLGTKGIYRVSNGTGKTTCGWIHPDGKQVMFSSTHADPAAKQKQKEELDFRASGKTRRYSWDYDENYDIYLGDIRGRNLKNLTNAVGYDAEGSISPDGKLIAFSSNRHAYSAQLSTADKEKLEKDPSYFLDIYIMNVDGSNMRRLTTTAGYDGGPFFSPDGERIVWRRFSADGSTAEVYTMKINGDDQKQITRLGVMSWAPFYHPSGDYIVFTSNLYGYENFELFVVDTEGKQQPIRVTELEGFDGLPVFLPDGNQLAWARKGSTGDSQIHLADWDDQLVRRALGLPASFPNKTELSPEILAEDSQKFVNYLASESMRGRATGSAEEKIYAGKIAQYFKDLDIKPLTGDSYTQTFSFRKGARLGSGNELVVIDGDQKSLRLNEDWRPLSFSRSGESAASGIVFAGYGIKAPAGLDLKPYNSYEGLDVKDKWVMVFRYVPEDVEPKWRQHLLRYSRMEHKLMVAREQGARGVIFVTGPTAQSKNDLIPFNQGASGDSQLMAVTISNRSADQMLAASGKKLKELQKLLDGGHNVEGFELPNMKLSARLNLFMEEGQAQNVIGAIRVPGATYTVVIGAHGDHLGQGESNSSLKSSKDKTDIHFGADDNASGVAGVLELAHYFANEVKKGNRPRHNLVFAVWSGEELGNLGSSAFLEKAKKAKWKFSAYVNMDMIGRLTNEGAVRPLSVQGIGSSPDWSAIIEKSSSDVAVTLAEDPYLPTDAMSFYVQGIPVINLFSGVHTDYHTPRDTADKIDYLGVVKATTLAKKIVEAVAWSAAPIRYNKVDMTQSMSTGRGFRIFLGTIPDYSSSDVKGVKLSGVMKNGPAEKAGLQSGDVIVKLDTFKIESIHDYVYSLESLKPNQETQVTVIRDGKTQELSITPLARE